MLNKCFLGFLALTLCTTLTIAQGTSSLSFNHSLKALEASSETALESPGSWTFYHDSENSIFFIDFESINVNLNCIRVYDKTHQLIFQDDLSQLPVDAIYELHVKSFKPGTYSVELATYINSIYKDITVNN